MLLLELQQRKGRYWNYEKNRWSFCSDDSDAEDNDKTEVEKERNKHMEGAQDRKITGVKRDEKIHATGVEERNMDDHTEEARMIQTKRLEAEKETFRETPIMKQVSIL